MNREARRRRSEERLIDKYFPILLVESYLHYHDEGRGAIWLDMRKQDPLGSALYVTMDTVLRRVQMPGLEQDMQTYQPRSEVMFVFAYPESVWVRRRFGVDPLSGERLEVPGFGDELPS